MPQPIVIETRTALLEAVADLQARGESLALVPTMGALHEGHLALVREGLRRADRVAVSIFVNPTQFGPAEDLDRYPRDLPGDVARCAGAGVWLVFAPRDPSEIYPAGFQTWVDVETLGSGLCGASRPGHFRGVATVVTKLLAVFRPQVALFGEKDFQQLAVIRRVARDLELSAWTEIVGVPTVREADGLALSSRNAYLSPDERARALALYRALEAGREARAAGAVDAASILEAARARLEGQVDRVDYVELVDAATLEAVESVDRPARLLIAAFVGRTRLIDNVGIE